MRTETATVCGWGRFGPASVTQLTPANVDELATVPLPVRTGSRTDVAAGVIARGLGRSYGDAAQRDGGAVVATTSCTGSRWVDRDNGLIEVDAGVSVGTLIDRYAPKGWFVPVSPGTRHVTVGGAIAADIHGKNHHVEGSFARHVRSITVRLASDRVVRLNPDDDDPDLFWATTGGMGLTGVILSAEVQLHRIASTTVRVETQRLRSLDALLDEMRRSDATHTFSVAWVDLLGGARSVLTQGSFATPDQLAEAGGLGPAGVFARPSTSSAALPPVPLPRVARTSAARVFNAAWWRKESAEPRISHQSVTAFFHPLDAIRDWNRLYGRTGFVQWQCVVPDSPGGPLHELVERMGRMPSYFTVLKRFGAANAAPLSFPMPGWTLAVDLPATAAVIAGLPALDRLVAESGGRVYLAKDARLGRADFEAMYPRLDEWKRVRARVDPERRFLSDLAARLGL